MKLVPIPWPRNPHPDDQIRLIERDVAVLETGFCPYCEAGYPTKAMRAVGITKIAAKNRIRVLFRNDRGWSFKCPLHGVCGCSTSLVLCFLKEKENGLS